MTRRHSSPAWHLAAPSLFVMAWGGNHFTPLLHMYETLGRYSTVMADLFLGFYVVGLVPGLLLAGALSDRYGRKPLVVAGMAAGVIASLLLGLGFTSAVVLCVGRFFAGVSVGVAMSVGTAWIKELSSPPFDYLAGRTAGARRPALTLTLGFGLGAGVAGALAQWGPLPTLAPYAVHIALSILVLPRLLKAPETITPRRGGSLLEDLRVPLAGHRRFVRVIAPSAPWVFGAAGVAYAIMPALVADRLGGLDLAFATLLTVVTLGCGACVQPFVARLNRLTDGRALVCGMAVMLVGVLLGVATAVTTQPLLAVATAITLGCAYGTCIVAGLIEIQRIATPDDLAGITGVYYCLTYTGFLLPVVFASLSALTSYAVLLSVLAGLCAICLALVAYGVRRV